MLINDDCQMFVSLKPVSDSFTIGICILNLAVDAINKAGNEIESNSCSYDQKPVKKPSKSHLRFGLKSLRRMIRPSSELHNNRTGAG